MMIRRDEAAKLPTTPTETEGRSPRGRRRKPVACVRQKTLALGVYPIVSLADARAARDAAKKLLARDIDPEAKKEQKRAARLSAKTTFEAVAREWCENQRNGWTGRYHDHVVTRLEADVFPELGSRPIAEIATRIARGPAQG